MAALWLHAATDWRKFDLDQKLVFYGTGNSYALIPHVYPAKPGLKNDALYTNSTLAIDPEKGVVKWYFQHLPTDIFDLDYSYERMMIDLPVNGVMKHQVVTVGKTGIIEALDRTTGGWLWSRETVPQNVVQSIDPTTGKKTYNPDVLPAPGKASIPTCPADPGGRGWPATAYNPKTQTLFMPLNEFCAGAAGLVARPESDGKVGRMDAINLATKATVWSNHQRPAFTSAVLPTAGGVVFGGDLDRYFRAYDQATGKVLWQARLNNVVNSFPVT